MSEQKMAADRLAPVTYLPGVQPPAATFAQPIAEVVVDEQRGDRDLLGRDREERRAENVSLAALTRRGMSKWEMETALRSRDLDEQVIADEIARLENVALIDDYSFAATLARSLYERKGLGHSAIVAELRRRHFEQGAIDCAFDEFDADDEQGKAIELATKRAGQLSSYDYETAKRRLTGFLMRKGYSSSIVRTAVDTALPRGASGVRFR